MTHKTYYSPNKDAMVVFCKCNHTKNSHYVKKQGCVSCECKKYKERKRTHK